MLPVVAAGALQRRYTVTGWGNLGWPEVGEFDRPTGAIGDATLADAILDRLVHNAHQLNLKGDSLRKKRANLTSPTHQE
jgi:hypothetical protein